MKASNSNLRTSLCRAVLVLVGVAALAAASAHAQTLTGTRSSSFTYRADGLLASETIEPGNAQFCVSTTHSYDAYGNRMASTVQNCAGASGLAAFEARTTSTAFSSYTTTVAGVSVTVPAGQLSTGSTNALSQTETRVTDPRFGVVTSLTGPNALSTSWQYDDFGRRVKESRADGTQTQVAYCLISGRVAERSSNSGGCSAHSFAANEVPALAVRYEHSVGTNAAGSAIGPYTRSYYDRAGRVIRVASQAFDGAAQPGGANRLLVQDTDYDAFGQVAVATQPYFLDSGSSTPGGSGDRGMSATTYDALGRAVEIYGTDPQGQAGSLPFGSRGSYPAARTRVAYAGLSTITTNDQGYTRQEESNLEGKVIRIVDALGAQLVRQYDAFDNLVRSVDALGNRIEASFDSRGRKTALNDPDAGVSVYCYDALGQLKAQQNSKMRGSHSAAGCPSINGAGTTVAAVAGWTTLAYDKLGRQTQRVEPEYTSNWSYDGCSKGIGKLCSSNTSHGVSRSFTYDSLGRPSSSRVDVSSGISAASAVGYDGNGRVETVTYPTGLQIGLQYTARGYLNTVTNKSAFSGVAVAANTVLWRAQSVNAWGRVQSSTRSNGVTEQQDVQGQTGRISRIYAGPGTQASITDHRYTWNSLNQLTQRIDALGDTQGAASSGGTPMQVADSYDYDALGRLVKVEVSGGIGGGSSPNVVARTVRVQYNALGLVLGNSEVGNYSYPGQGTSNGRPHAVQGVSPLGSGTSRSYGYDLSGNVISSSGSAYSSLTLTSFNLPASANGAASTAYAWQYDENHQRIKETRTNSAGTRTTWYLHPDNSGGLGFEREETSAGASNRHYLNVAGQTIGVVITSGALPSLGAALAPPLQNIITIARLEYWYRDHQGSLIATTDHAGNLTRRYAYDAFGKRREVRGSYDSFGALVIDWGTGAGTDRGYTGHEHLDDIGIVHMNGRLFDPLIGRFMQADPFVQAPGSLQSYDRYQYCFNSPGNCTDPSGYFSLGISTLLFLSTSAGSPGIHYLMRTAAHNPTIYQIGSIAGAAAATYWCGWLGPAAVAGCNAAGAAAWNGYAGGSAKDMAKAAAIAGATAYMYGQLGQASTAWAVAEKVAAHAIMGCWVATAQGGGTSECAAAAFAGGVGKYASLEIAFLNKPEGMAPLMSAVAIEATIGGTASVIAGGKFANGAKTAAFGYLFNHLLNKVAVRDLYSLSRGHHPFTAQWASEYRAYISEDALALLAASTMGAEVRWEGDHPNRYPGEEGAHKIYNETTGRAAVLDFFERNGVNVEHPLTVQQAAQLDTELRRLEFNREMQNYIDIQRSKGRFNLRGVTPKGGMGQPQD